MNSVICHVELVQRGAVAAAARLTDPRTSASWVFSKAGSEDAPRDSVVTLSRWISQQLAAAGDSAELMLCLDVDQAACGWVTSSGTDDKAVKTAVRDAQAPGPTAGLPGRLDQLHLMAPAQRLHRSGAAGPARANNANPHQTTRPKAWVFQASQNLRSGVRLTRWWST